MLAAVLQVEVTAYVAAFVDQIDDNGHRLAVRNGDQQLRETLTSAGAIEVKAPRVRDRRFDLDSVEW